MAARRPVYHISTLLTIARALVKGHRVSWADQQGPTMFYFPFLGPVHACRSWPPGRGTTGAGTTGAGTTGAGTTGELWLTDRSLSVYCPWLLDVAAPWPSWQPGQP